MAVKQLPAPRRKVVNMAPEYEAKVDALLATFELRPLEKTLFEYLVDSELVRRGIDPETLQPASSGKP